MRVDVGTPLRAGALTALVPLLVTLLALCGGCCTCPWCGRPMPQAAEGESAAGTPIVSEPVVLRGSVTYLERVAMHPSADVVIRLHDVSPLHAAPVLVAERVLRRPGQAPVEFALPVESCRILPGHDYALSACIVVDGTTLFSTSSASPVEVTGTPVAAQLILSRVPAEERPLSATERSE